MRGGHAGFAVQGSKLLSLSKFSLPHTMEHFWQTPSTSMSRSPTRCAMLAQHALPLSCAMCLTWLTASVASVQVEKQLAKFYSLHVSQQQLDEGFIISAYSASGSKFKLLLFEATADGRHELVFSASIQGALTSHVAPHLHFQAEELACTAGGVQKNQEILFSWSVLPQVRSSVEKHTPAFRA